MLRRGQKVAFGLGSRVQGSGQQSPKDNINGAFSIDLLLEHRHTSN